MRFSVVICAFTERRLRELGDAIASVRGQSAPALETVVVIDHNDDLLDRATRAWGHARVVANRHARGLSGARNTGLEVASGEVVAFLDDDAYADERWLEQLTCAYEDPRVVGAGGVVEPVWPGDRPAWFPPEFDWVVGCTHSGMPQETATVRNLVGANMSFRRDALQTLGGFRDGLGRIGSKPVGCEETELCIRAQQRWPDQRILYVPGARVRHRVSADRTTLRYFLSRCRAEGISKAQVARLVGRDDGLESERSYVRRTLPSGIVRDVRGAAHGTGSVARPAAIFTGLAATTLGYVQESARAAPRREPAADDD